MLKSNSYNLHSILFDLCTYLNFSWIRNEQIGEVLIELNPSDQHPLPLLSLHDLRCNMKAPSHS